MMTARLHSLKAIASIALVAATCAWLAACGGGGTGFRPVPGDQMKILPPQGSPDLAVGTPSVSDSGPAAGADFTLSATVRNTGDGEAPATTLRYYRSTDAAITTSDTEVGTDAVGALSASGTSEQSISLTAPSTAGAYYYGACVDAVAGESGTADNCSPSVQVIVPVPQVSPDLTVGTPSVSDSGPAAGASFTLSATVRNTGDGEAPATTLRYYRSTDAAITTSDTEVGTDAVGALSASGTSEQSISLTAPSTAGTYYYGACVDAVPGESGTADSCSPSVQVIVPVPQVSPDLTVGTPSVSDSGPAAGADFTLSATVNNTGDGEAPATTLRWYRSTDAAISTSDTEVGTDAVGALSASGTSAESISLTASAIAGTYYYGACVDAVAGESDTADNCSPSVQVIVPVPQVSPDLTVGTPSVSDSGPAAGASFILSATVRNSGDGDSPPPTVRYYRSTDATITTSDTEVGTDAVARLAASGSASESVELAAPSTQGTYYYGACVDAVAGESDTTDNCSPPVAVVVEEAQRQPQGSPDLAVGSPSVSDDRPSAGAGFTLSATVRNDGDGASPATTLRWYRSTDATISTSDAAVGTDAVARLAASGSAVESLELTAPPDAGTYYYGACVDAVAGESDTADNCSGSVAVVVVIGPSQRQQPRVRPDLALVDAFAHPSFLDGGQRFIFGVTVRNQGDGESLTNPTLRYYLSRDATISADDREVGTDWVDPLAVSGRAGETITLTAPSAPGTYYYGACVGAVPGEIDTTDNCSSAVAVTTVEGPPSSGGPDLSVPSSYAIPDSSLAGETFVLVATVRNRGDGEAASTTVRFYRSTDAAITTSDTEVGTASLAGLAASASNSRSMNLIAPPDPGTYYYGACVDAVADETETANNCSLPEAVTVTETRQQPAVRPDLALVDAYVTPSGRLDGGQRFIFGVTVRNRGNGESLTNPTLRYYLSRDATISADDRQVGTDHVDPLAVSGRAVETISLTAPSTPGTYYYGACVGAVPGETDTSDNCSSSVAVTVEGPPPSGGPDLSVYSFYASPDSSLAGEGFVLVATVRNRGDGAAASTTLRFYRSTDATVATSDTEVGTDSVAGLAASARSSVLLRQTAPSDLGTYYYGACVDAVAGESDTANNCSPSATVTVIETRPQPLVRPDLALEAAYVTHSSLEGGQRFIFGVTVRNRGDGESLTNPTLRYYRSLDATISADDRQVGTDHVDPLAVSGRADETISLTAPSYSGTYYYGACVGAVPAETNTSNNCSSAVAVTVEGELHPEPPADLLVQSPSATPDSLIAGQSFTLSAGPRNNGGKDAAATTLRYYRSSDSTITTSDTEVGTDAVAALKAWQTGGSESVILTAPSSAGTYYYGACVDSVSGETDTANNCSSAVAVTVRSAPPDTTDTTSGRYGAFAYSFTGGCTDEGNYAVGLVVDKASEVEALNAARQACLDDGGRSTGCTPHLFSEQCLAVGFGVGGAIGCTLGPGHGATLAAAKEDKLSFCRDRQGFTTCTIVASGCNSQGSGS